MKNVLVKSMVLVLIISFLGAQPALAYIDPSTGGMLFQILAVAFASLSAILLIFSRQIRTFVARLRRLLRGSRAEEEGGAGVEPPPPPNPED
jgi:hypothetical protein